MENPICESPVAALVGNPNVGKSTLFNALTGLRQHTGNWPGKTVEVARGTYDWAGRSFTLVDLPGTYSLCPQSAEEEVALDYLRSGEAQVTIVVTDATALERNLSLVLQTIEETWPVVVAVNLMDEAEKKGIRLDLPKLQELLGCPVVGCTARDGDGLTALCAAVGQAVDAPPPRPEPPFCAGCAGCAASCRTAARMERASAIAALVMEMDDKAAHRRDRRIDKLLTSKATGVPLMLLLLALVLWITIAGANIPSELLADLLFRGQEPLRHLLEAVNAPWWIVGALVDGVYRTLAWVISVMLPPMAIFFPLFTLLEDAGYLPRVAFDLDHFFHKAGAHGRQSLTMCMGLGCNACGVMGCRIIQSPRERLIAILTNAFVPCNGRFPTLIALISMFFVGEGLWGSLEAAVLLALTIVLAVAVTLLVSRILSRTILKGMPSSFSLELPPYRAPKVGQVLVRSLLDRTLFVLGRAVLVAAPAGLIIWIAANVSCGDGTILQALSGGLDPLGRLLGMDGIILLAFILGFPANEIVVPCILMGYLSAGALTDFTGLAELHAILTANGWTVTTAVCTLLFTLFHFPCGTTCLTIRQETGSIKWTLLAFLLPTAVGMALCFLVDLFMSLLI